MVCVCVCVGVNSILSKYLGLRDVAFLFFFLFVSSLLFSVSFTFTVLVVIVVHSFVVSLLFAALSMRQ